jgi:hypothetical protein
MTPSAGVLLASISAQLLANATSLPRRDHTISRISHPPPPGQLLVLLLSIRCGQILMLMKVR